MKKIALPFKKKNGVTSDNTEVTSTVVINNDGSRIIPQTSTDTVVHEDNGVIKIGKKKYAVDLNRDNEPEGNIKDEAAMKQPIGKAEKWNLYAKIPNRRVAYASSDIGHKKGMIPLAESISREKLGDNWIVVIPLDGDKFWIAEKEEGNIVSDEIFTNFGMAKEQVLGKQVKKTRPIVAPETWGISGSTQASLSDLLGQKTPALRRFSLLSNYAPQILMAAMVVGVVGGSYYYFQNLEAKRIQEERDLAARRDKRIIVNDSDYPWYQTPVPIEFVNSCKGMMDASIRMIPGWAPQSPVCQYSEGRVVVTQGYLREPEGRIAWLRSAYEGADGNVSLSENANTASYSVSQPLTAEAGSFNRNAPWTDVNIRRVLVERFQNIGLSPNLVDDVSRANEDTAEKAIFNSVQMEISTGFFPEPLVEIMEDVPATVPETLIWDMKNNIWTLSMRVYHPAILPLGAI